MLQKITPFLWFDGQAEEAAKFYVSLFKNSRINRVTRYNDQAAEASGQPAGSVMTVDFELEGQRFVALNGGPMFKFNEAVSFMIQCETQEEVDHFWNKLTENGGEESMCGWLRDKYGLAWQVTPTVLMELIGDPERGERAMAAMMTMRKIDIAAIENA